MWTLRTADGEPLPVPRLPAVVGSDAAADVRLVHPSVRPRHVRLAAGEQDDLLIDALDDAYVEVGGWEVRRASVRDGEQVQLGALAVTLDHWPGVEFPEGDGPGSARARGDPAPAAVAEARPGLGGPAPSPGSSHPAGRAAPGAARPGTLGRRPSPGSRAGTGLALRPRALPVRQPPARAGLLHADLSQLSGGLRWALGLLGLLLGAAVVWGLSTLLAAL